MKYGIVITTKTLATKDGSATDIISGSREEMLDLAKQWSHEEPSADTAYEVFRLNTDGTVMNLNDPEGHDWKWLDVSHPEVTGWKCKNCKRVTTTYGETPRTGTACAPDSDPVA